MTKVRRATTAGSEKKDKKQLKTYGSKSCQDIFDFQGSSDGEQDVSFKKRLESSVRLRDKEQPHLGGQSKNGACDIADDERLRNYEAELHGNATMVNSHLSSENRHGETSPVALLHRSMLPPTLPPTVSMHAQQPDSSTISTVPFSTPAQSTPMEDSESFQFPTSDDRMPTPTVSSKSHSDAEKLLNSSHSHAKSKKRTIEQINVPSQSNENLGDLESIDTPPRSKRARIEHDPDIMPSPKEYQDVEKNIIQQEQHHALASKVDTLVDSMPFAADRTAITKTLDDCGGNIDLAASRLLDAEEQWVGRDELSFSASSAVGSVETRSSRPDRKKRQEDRLHIDELGSDDVDVGLPKEQYQPRPSRSRSGQVEGDNLVVPVDFSKRPEALVKSKKSKRRKTTALAKATPKYEEDEEEVVPLFSVPNPKSIESESKPTPDHVKPAEIQIPGFAFDAQCNQEAALAASQPPPKKQKGRPHKKPIEFSEEVREEHPLIDNGDEDTIAKRVEEPRTNEPSVPKKQRGRPQTKAAEPLEEPPTEHAPVHNKDEYPDGDPADEDQGPKDPTPAPTAKKQRGRPKKKATNKTQEDIQSDLDDEHEELPLSPRKSHKRKNSATAESTLINADDDETPLTQQNAPTAPLTEKANTTNPLPAPQPPATPPAQKKGPDKHSPLQSGKVRYRVGLSKKARIAPLLRVVPK